jgi:adenosine deaminase
MADVENALPIAARRELRLSLDQTNDPFIQNLPKVELHVHIEGTLTPELKWKFAQRNCMELKHPRTGMVFSSLSELQDSHDTMKSSTGDRMDNAEETLSFFETYYSGFDVLKTKQDYCDLAMHYFERAANMNVRYCELFFDPQGHTRTGVAWSTMMSGFHEAQLEAEEKLNVRSVWILCFLRDESPDSAMEHYLAALEYRRMIIGIGLDSNEDKRPPMLFEEVFTRARLDGFRITAHCDVGKTYPVEHIRQTVSEIGKTGADRIDHGLNVVDDPQLMKLIREKELGMTICPWSYIRHQPFEEIFARIRTLFDAGIKISIGSDDPAFMEDTWIYENLLVAKKFCGLSNKEILKMMKYAVIVSWAPQELKQDMLRELEEYVIS